MVLDPLLGSSDKGGISALRLSKLIGVTWKSTYLMLIKLRKAMGNRDSYYRITDIIELDDALVGNRKTGKRGRGAEGKIPLLVACENREGRPGFLTMEAVDSVTRQYSDIRSAQDQGRAAGTILMDTLRITAWYFVWRTLPI